MWALTINNLSGLRRRPRRTLLGVLGFLGGAIIFFFSDGMVFNAKFGTTWGVKMDGAAERGAVGGDGGMPASTTRHGTGMALHTPAVSRRWWVAWFHHHNGFYYGSGPDISVVLLGFGFGFRGEIGNQWRLSCLFLVREGREDGN